MCSECRIHISQRQSFCKVGSENLDVKIVYDSDTKALTILPLTSKGMKCTLYFDYLTPAKKTLNKLGATIASGTPTFGKTSCTAGSNNGSDCGESTVGIYNAEDDDGISYYYRGSVDNNYVKFAGFYWRIIRINGNGSIRLIYSGKISNVDTAGKTTVLANGYDDSSTLYTQIQTSAFKGDTYQDNTYVGFMYGTANSTTYSATHTNTNPSTIKEVLDAWYTSNLASYADYLDINTGFCGDRELDSTTTGTGTGKSVTNYATYYRLYTKKLPSLKCTNKTRDLYTITSATAGNKALSNPIGLITADEIALAGGLNQTTNNNYGFYLYTGYDYWSISPIRYYGIFAQVWQLRANGSLYHDSVTQSDGVRPVINIKTEGVTILGSGTIASPYTIS